MTWAVIGGALSSVVGSVGAGAAGAGAAGAGAAGAAGAVGSLGAGALSAGSVLGSGSALAGAGGALGTGAAGAGLGTLTGAGVGAGGSLLGSTATGPMLGSALSGSSVLGPSSALAQTGTGSILGNSVQGGLLNGTQLGGAEMLQGQGMMMPNSLKGSTFLSGEPGSSWSGLDESWMPSNDTMMKAYLGSKLLGGDKKQQQRSAPAISAPGRAGNPSAMMLRQPVGLLGGRPQRRSFRR